MVTLYLICLMVSLVYVMQIFTSLFVYYVYMKKLRNFETKYKNMNYLKISFGLFVMLVVSILIFRLSIISFVYPVIAFSSFGYLKKYYKNIIMQEGEVIYNGAGTFKISSVKKVFIENGSNLEKKYGVKHIGIEKFAQGDYLIFQFNNDYLLTKNCDFEYLNYIKSKFNIE